MKGTELVRLQARLGPAAKAEIARQLAPRSAVAVAPQVVRLTLPLPPSINHYYRNIVIGGHARTLISADGRAYKLDVVGVVKAANLPRPTFTGPVWMLMAVSFADRRRQDISNRIKSLEDALQGAEVVVDDSQFRFSAIGDTGERVPDGQIGIAIGALPSNESAILAGLRLALSEVEKVRNK